MKQYFYQLQAFFKRIIQNCRQAKGNAIAISLTAISVLLIASIGVSSIILASYNASKNIERSSRAFLASEGCSEIILYELAQHTSGFELGHSYGENDYGRINLGEGTGSECWVSATSLDSMSSTSGLPIVILPQQEDFEAGDETNMTNWDDWTESSFGATKVINLYSDQTSVNKPERNCQNKIDDDNDGFTDCEDLDCSKVLSCQ
jgi:hypothetical protein